MGGATAIMYRYILKRLLLVIPTLFGAAVLVFTLLRLIPGDICELRMAGSGGYFDEDAIQICRHEMGIDQPVLVQFLQAYIFTILACVYIGLSMAGHDEHEEHSEVVDLLTLEDESPEPAATAAEAVA